MLAARSRTPRAAAPEQLPEAVDGLGCVLLRRQSFGSGGLLRALARSGLQGARACRLWLAWHFGGRFLIHRFLPHGVQPLVYTQSQSLRMWFCIYTKIIYISIHISHMPNKPRSSTIAIFFCSPPLRVEPYIKKATGQRSALSVNPPEHIYI